MINNETKRKIYLEWVEEARKADPKKHEGEFTLDEFCKDAHIGRETGLLIITQKLKTGEVSQRVTSKGTFYTVIKT